jgi:hypothetical protein
MIYYWRQYFHWLLEKLLFMIFQFSDHLDCWPNGDEICGCWWGSVRRCTLMEIDVPEILRPEDKAERLAPYRPARLRRQWVLKPTQRCQDRAAKCQANVKSDGSCWKKALGSGRQRRRRRQRRWPRPSLKLLSQLLHRKRQPL